MQCCNNNKKAIILVRGNDTNFNDAQGIKIYINTTVLDLSTFKAVFKLGNITKTFDDISSGEIELNFTAAETARLLTECYGTLNLIDTSNRIATIENRIPFEVISVVDGNAIATEPYTLNFDVKQQGETILNISVESAVTVEVGQTTTLPPGSEATVTNAGTPNHLILDFGIPRGYDPVWGHIEGDIMEQQDLQDELTSISGGLADSITALDDKFTSITGALDDKIDSVSGALSDSISAVDDKYNSITGGLSDDIDALESVVSANFTTLSDSITALDSVVSDNYNTLDDKIDSINGALSDSITALDSIVSDNFTTLSDSITNNYNTLDSLIGGVDDKIDTHIADKANPHEVTASQVGLGNVDNTSDANKPISTATQNALDSLSGAITNEETARQNADNGLQSQIDALVVASDVFDIVGTYAELQAYNISTVPVNDIIKVLVDSTHDNAATYYRCTESGGVKSWTYIGAEGAYYTKSESDGRFVPLTRTVNGKALSNNISLDASDVGAVASVSEGSTNGTISVDGTDVNVHGLGSAAYTSSGDYATSIQGGLADSAIQSVKVNGTALTPDVNKTVDVTVPTNYVTTDTNQDITGTKTYIGQKKIEFKQSGADDKLGFTCFDASSNEIGAFEYRPNTINGGALLNVNVSYASTSYVGFRYWGTNVNIVAPKVTTAGSYYIPVNVTNGNTTVTANNVGTVDISSLMPSLSGYQTTANLTTSWGSTPSDSKYPSEKLVYDTIGNVESILQNINSGT